MPLPTVTYAIEFYPDIAYHPTTATNHLLYARRADAPLPAPNVGEVALLHTTNPQVARLPDRAAAFRVLRREIEYGPTASCVVRCFCERVQGQ